MFSQTFLLIAAFFGGDAAATNAPAATPAVDVGTASPRAIGQSFPDGASAATHGRPMRVAAALSASDVVSKVQAFYTDTKQLTALFRQTYTNTTFGKKSISDGKVWIKKPGKMRWDYQGKKKKSVNKSFISDGTTLWAVEHDNKQVMRTRIEDDVLPVAVTFLFGTGDLSRDFTAKLDKSGSYGTKTDHVLELTPRTPSAQYKKLFLVVDPQDFRVKQSVVVEASGNTNHFRFYSPDTKKAVQDAWFVFNERKYENYRLVEPEALKPQK